MGSRINGSGEMQSDANVGVTPGCVQTHARMFPVARPPLNRGSCSPAMTALLAASTRGFVRARLNFVSNGSSARTATLSQNLYMMQNAMSVSHMVKECWARPLCRVPQRHSKPLSGNANPTRVLQHTCTQTRDTHFILHAPNRACCNSHATRLHVVIFPRCSNDLALLSVPQLGQCLENAEISKHIMRHCKVYIRMQKHALPQWRVDHNENAPLWKVPQTYFLKRAVKFPSIDIREDHQGRLPEGRRGPLPYIEVYELSQGCCQHRE
jgi:hypothetical protein